MFKHLMTRIIIVEVLCMIFGVLIGCIITLSYQEVKAEEGQQVTVTFCGVQKTYNVEE